MNTLDRILKNSFWVLFSKILIQLFQFLVTIILARLLSPNDFGLVAMVAVLRAFLNVFLTTGFNVALIQKQDVTDTHKQTIFTLTFLIGALLFFISWVMAPSAANFFNNDKVTQLFRISALAFIVGPFSCIQVAMLSKRMEFYKLSKLQICQALFSFVPTLFMAFNGYGAVAMVAGPVISNFAILPICYLLYPWLPKFSFDFNILKEMFGFTWRVFATNMIEFFSRNMDNTLIGRYLGSTALGFYNLSYNLMMLPLENIAFPIRNVLLPGFSEIQGNPKESAEVYCRFLSLVSAIVFPAMVGMFIVADVFIITAYGEKWNQAVPILKILCLSGILQAIAIPNNNFLLSKGRSDTVFYLSILGFILYVSGFIVGLKWGALGVATGYTTANLIITPVSFFAIHKIVSIPKRLILSAFISPLAGTLAMSAFIIIILQPAMRGIISKPLFQLVVQTSVGTIVYGVYSSRFLKSEWRTIIQSVKA